MRHLAPFLLAGGLLCGAAVLPAQVIQIPPRGTVAQLPAPSPSLRGRIRSITDGASPTDCTVGGGSFAVLCIDTGSAWTVGAVGPQGAPGATGATGAAGADGIPKTVLDEGSALTQRSSLNFIGAGVTCVDNSGAARTDCTIPGGGTGDIVGAGVSGGQTINGDTAASGSLVLKGTANATKGNVTVDFSTLRLVKESSTPNGRMVDYVDATNGNQLMQYLDGSGYWHAYQNGGFEVDVSGHGFIAGSTSVFYGINANSRMVPVNNASLDFYAGSTKTAAASANGIGTSTFTDTPPASCTASPAEIAIDIGTTKRICVCVGANTWKCANLT